MQESPERSAAREAVGKAILEYARVWAKELDIDDDVDLTPIADPILEGWVVAVAVTLTELAQGDREAGFAIIPHDQPRVMTLGLLWQRARDF